VLGIRQETPAPPHPPPPPKTGKKRKKRASTVHCPTNALPIHRAYLLHFQRIFFEIAAEENSKPPTLLRKDCIPPGVPPRLYSLLLHSFHCLLFMLLSLLVSCGFCCRNLPKQVETVNAPFRELARSESRNLETRCTEAADRRPTLVIFYFLSLNSC
jgi:hypothetical protein